MTSYVTIGKEGGENTARVRCVSYITVVKERDHADSRYYAENIHENTVRSENNVMHNTKEVRCVKNMGK